jgi:hypothetical protein
VDAGLAELLGGGVGERADGRLPRGDQAAPFGSGASGGGAGDLDQRSAAVGQGARGAGEEDEGLPGGGNGPGFEAVERRVDERTAAEAARRRPGRDGVDDQCGRPEFVRGSLEGAGELARIGGDGERPVIRQRLEARLGAGDGRDTGAVGEQVARDRSAEGAGPEYDGGVRKLAIHCGSSRLVDAGRGVRRGPWRPRGR